MWEESSTEPPGKPLTENKRISCWFWKRETEAPSVCMQNLTLQKLVKYTHPVLTFPLLTHVDKVKCMVHPESWTGSYSCVLQPQCCYSFCQIPMRHGQRGAKKADHEPCCLKINSPWTVLEDKWSVRFEEKICPHEIMYYWESNIWTKLHDFKTTFFLWFSHATNLLHCMCSFIMPQFHPPSW